jgi:hypothetical protein
MLTCSESSDTTTLSKPALPMDCRVKPGNDEIEHRSRDTFMCPSLADHEANRLAPGNTRDPEK